MNKKGKFKGKIVEQIKSEEIDEQKQIALQKKYGTSNDVVVVEKTNTIKFLTKTLIGLIRFIAATAIFLLAITGIACLVFPDTRQAMIARGNQTFDELLKLFSLSK